MAETIVKRHPVRGFLWGLMTGLGVALLLMVFSIVPLSIPTLGIYAGASAVLGVLWGYFGPPKQPKGAAPTPPPPAATA